LYSYRGYDYGRGQLTPKRVVWEVQQSALLVASKEAAPTAEGLNLPHAPTGRRKGIRI